MRPYRRHHRGLAEIVGTLMLVVIVVAAATAFSFFVSAEESATLAQRTQNHLRELENVSIEGITVGSSTVTISLSSTDTNDIFVTGLLIGGNPVERYESPTNHWATLPSYNQSSLWASLTPTVPSACTTGPGPCAYFSDLELAPFAVTPIVVNLTGGFFVGTFVAPSHEIQVSISTDRGNDFVDTFLAPIAKIGVTYLDGWPILDGTESYQPAGAGANNSYIDSWVWSVGQIDSIYSASILHYYGQSVELPWQFSEGETYWINLTVTDTFGLVGTANVSYSLPGTLSGYTVEFNETGLPASADFNFNATLGSLSAEGGTGETTITFQMVPNGTYQYAVPEDTVGSTVYAPIVAAGTVAVLGANRVVDVSFGEAYDVTFVETGLPTGTEWFVDISGQPSLSSMTSSIDTMLPDGTFDYVVGTVSPGYEAGSSPFAVEGAATMVPVTFTDT